MGLESQRILPTLIAAAFVASVILLYASTKNGANKSKIENGNHQREFQTQVLSPIARFLTWLFIAVNNHQMPVEDECVPVCASKECVIYAKILLNNMKPNANPCENIHTFACGAFEEKFGEEETRNMQHESKDNMYRVLEYILQNIKADSESSSGKMKIVYDSCVNIVSREKEALLSAKSFLAKVGIPDWPNLPLDFQIDVTTTLAKLKENGEIQFFMFVVPSPEFSYDYFQTNQSDMTIRVDIRYFQELLRKPNKAAIFHILKYFDLSPASMEDIWNDFIRVRSIILKLEKENCNSRGYECKEAVLKHDERSRYSGSEYEHLYEDDDQWFFNNSDPDCPKSNFSCSDPNYDPSSVCKIIDHYLISTGLNKRIRTENVKIQQGDDNFVMQIIPTLKTLPAKVLANFLALNFYKDHLDELNFYFRDTKDRYFHHKLCQGWRPRIGLRLGRICTGWIVDNMHLALQYEYQKKILNAKEMDKIIDAFNKTKYELGDGFGNQVWLVEEFRKSLKFQIENTSFNMMHLKEYQSRPQKYEFAINEYYKPFQPTRGKFFDNTVELRKKIHDIHWLSSSVNPLLLGMKFKSNALYRVNFINYYFGFLAPPYYIQGIPRLINLILLSSFMGHELGHAADTLFYRIRETPASPQIYALPEGIQLLFNKTKKWGKCLNNHFSGFKYEYINGNLNGSVLIPENVADNFFGFLNDKMIYKYFKNASTTEQVTLPGMSYSPIQVLYIVINGMLCEKSNHWGDAFHQEAENHSPWKFRSIGIMQNSKGFSAEFSCPEGSYMNPRNKCAFME